MELKRTRFWVAVVAFLLTPIHGVALAATDYSIFKGSCGALAISSNGLMAADAGGNSMPVFCDAQGKFIYTEPQPFTYGVPLSINKHGVALIDANENGDGYFFWTNGLYTRVPTEINYPQRSVRINDLNQVAVELSNGHVGLWQNGVLTDLGTLPGGSTSWVGTLNHTGEIGGSVITAAGLRQAVIWRNSAVIHVGVLAGDSTSTAAAISDSGEVFGFSFSDTTVRTFRWNNGVMTEMAPAGIFDRNIATWPPTKGVFAVGMNNQGQVIANDNRNRDSRTIVWTNGVITELNPILGYTPGKGGCNSFVISDSGLISAQCSAGGTGILTPTIPGTNLSLIMNATPNPISQGGMLRYTLNVYNVGSLAASDTTITDVLPASTSLYSVSTTQGSCSASTTVRCSLGTLAGGGVATVQITMIPNVAGTLVNTANVSSIEVDADTNNNSNTATVTVNAPVVNSDVGVSMSGSASSVKRLAKLTYTIRVNNYGPGNANSVTLKDVLPSAMKFVSASTTSGSCSGTTTVTCSLGTLANGATATVSIVVTASSRGTFTNTATVSTTSTDTNSSNNGSSVTTTVN